MWKLNDPDIGHGHLIYALVQAGVREWHGSNIFDVAVCWSNQQTLSIGEDEVGARI